MVVHGLMNEGDVVELPNESDYFVVLGVTENGVQVAQVHTVRSAGEVLTYLGIYKEGQRTLTFGTEVNFIGSLDTLAGHLLRRLAQLKPEHTENQE